jgi:hypothetical protein
VGRAGGVAGPAADDQLPIGAAAGGDLADVVGGQVGGLVGGLPDPAGAPVADDGAVVGDHAGPAPALGGVGVQVGAACSLGPLVVAFAVDASGPSPDAARAVEAAT